MKPEEFSTHSLPPEQQFEAWRSWFDPIFDTVPQIPAKEGFRASSKAWKLDGWGLSRVSAPSLRAARTTSLIRRAPVDHWVITVGSQVATAVTTAHETKDVQPGTPFVLSLGRVLGSEREQDDRLQLYLSRDVFPELIGVLDVANGTSIEGGFGAMLAEYVQLLERNLPHLDAADCAGLKTAIGAMVAACVAPSAERMEAAAEPFDVGRMEKVRRLVKTHLHSDRLTPKLLCKEAGMSRSQLYRLLDREGGVARYIQRRRLDKACAVLSDPTIDKPIAILAEELCFADPSAFSRAFRQEFDASPSDIRAAARASTVAATVAKRLGPAGADSLDRWLRTI